MPYSEANKIRAKVFLNHIRDITKCIRCGNKPVDFHREEHEIDGNKRVAHLAALGFPISRIMQEISMCEALCRSCHMSTDGRTQGLANNHPRKKGMI